MSQVSEATEKGLVQVLAKYGNSNREERVSSSFVSKDIIDKFNPLHKNVDDGWRMSMSSVPYMGGMTLLFVIWR